MKLAILQVADQGPLESLVVMLNTVGYRCATCSPKLQGELRALGCDTVLDHRDLTASMGYSKPFYLPEAGITDMERRDVLFVDVKAHRNGPLVWKRWPHLESKTLWYRINGGKPEHVKRGVCNACDGEGSAMYQWAKRRCVETNGIKKMLPDGTWCYYTSDGKEIEFKTMGGRCSECQGRGCIEDCGDEINPPCPVLTPNQWYKDKLRILPPQAGDRFVHKEPVGYAGKSYVCWPPFYRLHDYLLPRANWSMPCGSPICLIHNINGWGYRDLVGPMRELGVKCYGRGSPDGLIQHAEIPTRLALAMCMVHLKSNDAPGYAIYEAMAAGCPVVCTQRLIWRCRMQDLLEPGVTCLTFDHNETHEGLTPEQIEECTREVERAMELLVDPDFNRKLGEAGRERLKEITWNAERESDVESLKAFITKHFN